MQKPQTPDKVILARTRDYVRAIDTSIGFATTSLIFIWSLILGVVYNHYYPDTRIYYIILFQTANFIVDIIALFTLPMVNRRLASKIPNQEQEGPYNSSYSVLVSLITLYSIGLALMLGGWIWRLVLYNDCLNLPVTDPCRVAANGNTALVMVIFDILDLVPVVGAIITLSFSMRFLNVLRMSKRHAQHQPPPPQDPRNQRNAQNPLIALDDEGEQVESTTNANSRYQTPNQQIWRRTLHQ